MIQKVTSAKDRTPLSMKKHMESFNALKKRNKIVNYTNCIANHAIDSFPVLISITTANAIMNKKAWNMNFKQAFKYSIKNYFLPVLAVSSIFLTIFENKKSEK